MEIKDAINSVGISIDSYETKYSKTVGVDIEALECIMAYLATLEQREKQLLAGNDMLIKQMEEKGAESEQLRNWNKMLTAPKYDPKKKYTKDELWKCMQYACDVIGPSSGDIFSIINSSLGNYLPLKCEFSKSYFYTFQNVEYHEPLKPPAKNRLVLTQTGKVLYSNGAFTMSGFLCCDELPNCLDCGYALIEWCDFLDRSHHSIGWDEAWELDFKNGDAE